MMRWFMSIGIGMFLALGVSSAPVYGQTINVDFDAAAGSGTYSGTAAAPDAGTVWNGVSPPGGGFTSAPLVDSNGNPTAVTVSVEMYLEYAANENPATFARTLLTDFIYQTGGVGPNGIPTPFSINNLTPGAPYDLYFYSQNGGYSNTVTSFTIGATTKLANNDVPLPAAGGHGSFIENTNYVLFPGVIAAGGVIVGEFNDVEIANNAAFNGLQVRLVPEPASVASAIIGSAVLLIGASLRRRGVRARRRAA